MSEKSNIVTDNTIFGPNFQLQTPLITNCATRWEVLPLQACVSRRVLSKFTSHTLEYDGSPGTMFQGVFSGTSTLPEQMRVSWLEPDQA